MPQEPKETPEQEGLSRRDIFGGVSLATAGIAVTDVETSRMKLEDIFVHLIHAN